MGGIAMLLVSGLFIAFIVWVVRVLIISGDNRFSGTERAALAILEQRYARDEIDADEFRQKRHDLVA